MQTLQLKEVIDKLNNDEFQYNQFYNADIEASHYFSIQHYVENNHDSIDKIQILKTIFFDIECYFHNRTDSINFKEAEGTINAITIYDTKTKIYHAYLLIIDKNKHLIDVNKKQEYINTYKKELLENNYISTEEDIELYFCTNELQLIEDCWKKVHEIDPSVLSGFNCDAFDLPYIYNRLTKLYNGDENKTAWTLSKFGMVKRRKYGSGLVLFQIPEYPIADIRRLYMPRGEGGLNYGKTLANYSLDAISNKELNLKKLEYADTGMSLDKFYEVDPINFLKYNIIDVVLTVKLNEKLQHIELHNMLRRDMKTPFTASMVGVSALFTSMFHYELQKRNLGMRWGVLQESNNSIDETEIQNIDKPKENKMKWSVKKIDEQTYRKVLSRFPGAYVKEGLGKLLTIKDGILVDLDASLPPWEKIFIRRGDEVHWDNIGDYEFEEGDKTLTWNKQNERCWRKVKAKTVHDWNKQIVKITTETGKVVNVTTNHSIFGIKQGIKTKEVQLLEAGNLEKGDYVYCFKLFDPKGEKQSVNPDIINTHVKNIYTKTMGLEKIKKIEKIDYNGKVYDLSVEETERFFAGTGIGVHNTALYPSMMLQNNISFDTYYGRVIDLVAYKFINFLKDNMGTKKTYPPSLKTQVFENIKTAVNRIQPQNKNDYKQYLFFMFMSLLNKVMSTGKTFNEISKPKNMEDMLLLKCYLIPLIDLVVEINKVPEYNTFSYEYIINHVDKFDSPSYVIQHENEPSCNIVTLPDGSMEKFLKDNQISINLSGAMFYRHDYKIGILNQFLIDRLAMRKKYKNKRNEFKPGEESYTFYDRRQLSTKININSSYGLTGMSTFAFSNRQLASSTTLSGRVALKCSQAIGEIYLKSIEE